MDIGDRVVRDIEGLGDVSLNPDSGSVTVLLLNFHRYREFCQMHGLDMQHQSEQAFYGAQSVLHGNVHICPTRVVPTPESPQRVSMTATVEPSGEYRNVRFQLSPSDR